MSAVVISGWWLSARICVTNNWKLYSSSLTSWGLNCLVCPGLKKPTTVIWQLCHPGMRLSVSCLASQGHKMAVCLLDLLFTFQVWRKKGEGEEQCLSPSEVLAFLLSRSKVSANVICSFPVAAVSNYHRWGVLKQQKFIVTILEARSLKSGGAMFPPEALVENLSLPLPASGGCWDFLACGCITPIPISMVTLLSVCVSTSASLS